jgi:hypothetical protein
MEGGEYVAVAAALLYPGKTKIRDLAGAPAESTVRSPS